MVSQNIASFTFSPCKKKLKSLLAKKNCRLAPFKLQGDTLMHM